MVQRLGVLVGCLAAIAVGCGKKEAPPDENLQSSSKALQASSFPLTNAVTGVAWSYQAVLSKPGEATWSLVSGPTGAAVSSSGVVTWTPTSAQGGSQAFVLKAALDGEEIEQSFSVAVASFTQEAGKS